MFSNIGLMISRWEAQEAEEDTPIVEMVRKRRRSTKLEKIVVKLNLESEVTSDLQNTSSVEEKTTSNQNNNKLLCPAWIVILHQSQAKRFPCGTVDWAGQSGRVKVMIMDQMTGKLIVDLDQRCLKGADVHCIN